MSHARQRTGAGVCSHMCVGGSRDGWAQDKKKRVCICAALVCYHIQTFHLNSDDSKESSDSRTITVNIYTFSLVLMGDFYAITPPDSSGFLHTFFPVFYLKDNRNC